MSAKNMQPPAFVAGLGWAVVGFLLALVFLIDPLDLHTFDDVFLGQRGGSGEVEGAADATLWTCGMHPEVLQKEPGTCPICKMDLTPLQNASPAADSSPNNGPPPTVWTCPEHAMIEQEEPGTCPIGGRELVVREQNDEQSEEQDGHQHDGHQHESQTVTIDPAVVQNMNVRSSLAERRRLNHRVRSVGYLEYDQARMVTVTTKYSGWIDKVYVNYVGERVEKAQPLFEVYSPELVQTQEELLSALRFAERLSPDVEPLASERAQRLVQAAERRLRYWDISDDQIAWIRDSGEVIRTMTVQAPASGVVMKRMKGLEGMAIRPGMETFHLADLSALWVTVEVFEDQASLIGPGTPAEMSFSAFPGVTFRGKVRFIEPEVSEKTRTLRAKVDLENPDGRLRTGMFATVMFRPPSSERPVTVPALAVLRTGERDLVVMDLGDGRFAPRRVVLGHEHDGWVEVLAGVEEGERVVTSSQFLLDSESSLRAAIQKMAEGQL